MKKLSILLFSALLMIPPPLVAKASEMITLDDSNATEGVQQAVPEFNDRYIYVWQEDNGVLTKNDLLDYVNYDGDIQDLAITIESHEVYIIRGENTYYYHDLNRVLEKANIDDIVSFNEEHAIRQGFIAAEGSTSLIEQINLSHSTSYSVYVSNQFGADEAYLTVERRWNPGPPVDPPTTPVPDNWHLDLETEICTILTKEDLSTNISYDGKLEDLILTIDSHYVYANPEEKVYYHDLNKALEEWGIEDIDVLHSDDYWLAQDGYSSGENDSPQIDSINLSKMGEYEVTATDIEGTIVSLGWVQIHKTSTVHPPAPDPDTPSIDIPNLQFTNKTNNFKTLSNTLISEKELHALVEFDGDKNDLEFEITSNMVYTPKDSDVYHFNLSTVLDKTKASEISVSTEKEAIAKGLSPAEENNAEVDSINRTLPGKYTVIATYDFGEEDGRSMSVQGEITVTGRIVSDKDSDSDEDDKNVDDNKGKDKESDNDKKTDTDQGSSSVNNNNRTNSTTSVSRKAGVLPKTGSLKSSSMSLLGLALIASGIVIFKKKN